MLQYFLDAGFDFQYDPKELAYHCSEHNISFLNGLGIDTILYKTHYVTPSKIRELKRIGYNVDRLEIVKMFFKNKIRPIKQFIEIVDAGLNPAAGDSYAYIWASSLINSDFKILDYLRENNVPLPKSQNMIYVSARNKSLRLVDYYIDLGLTPNHYHVLSHYNLMSRSEKVFNKLTMLEIRYIIKKRPEYLEVVKQWDPKFNVGNTCSLITNSVYTDINIIVQN
jgi:hypothetical protein